MRNVVSYRMIGEVMSALAVATKPSDQRTDDVDLVVAVRAGDDRAFEQLFLRYQSRIAAYVRGMVRDHERAEDVTQEVFIAALRRLRATETPIAFKPWIYEIAKNACIDAFRRSRRTSEVPFEDDDASGASLAAHGGAPETVVDTKLAIDNLCGAFGGLSQAHHDILVMREFEGLSYREIGDRLGMSRAAVESALFRARRRLSEEYEELVSGERCLRVRAILDAPPGRAVGLRDQRRMARHIAHCQPCRRHARLAGVGVDTVRVPAAARIAALIPLPAFMRRRFDLDDTSQLLGAHSASATQWSKVVAVLDPATVSGWPRAIAAAATVAVAGLGAGAAVGERPHVGGVVFPAGGARIAPVLAPPAASPERAARVSTRPSAVGRGAAPGALTPTGRAREAEQPADGRPRTAAPVVEDPVPAAAPGSEPAATPYAAATDSGGRGVGVTSPERELPTADVTADDLPTIARPPRDRPGGGLIQGVGSAAASVETSLPDTLGHVVDTVGNTIATGAAQGAGGAAGGVTTADPAAASGGPVSTVIGQVLSGAH